MDHEGAATHKPSPCLPIETARGIDTTEIGFLQIKTGFLGRRDGARPLKKLLWCIGFPFRTAEARFVAALLFPFQCAIRTECMTAFVVCPTIDSETNA